MGFLPDRRKNYAPLMSINLIAVTRTCRKTDSVMRFSREVLYKFVDKMNETGHQARAGQEVRLVDIPADAGCGLGVFENIHGFSSADVFARTLRDNALKYYGTPSRSFLEKLATKLDHIGDAIARARADFVSRNVPKDASGQVSRVANRFALIAAAGRLLRGWGYYLGPPTKPSTPPRSAFVRGWSSGVHPEAKKASSPPNGLKPLLYFKRRICASMSCWISSARPLTW
jgi:hypothetical protein